MGSTVARCLLTMEEIDNHLDHFMFYYFKSLYKLPIFTEMEPKT